MRDFRAIKKEWWDKKCPQGVAVNLATIDHSDEPTPSHGDRWGRWEYDEKNKCIEHTKLRDYWIAISRLNTPAKLGTWCLHLSAKRWITKSDLANLVYAASDLCNLHR